MIVSLGFGFMLCGSSLPDDTDRAAVVLWRLSDPETDRVRAEVCAALGVPGKDAVGRDPHVRDVAKRLGLHAQLDALMERIGGVA